MIYLAIFIISSISAEISAKIQNKYLKYITTSMAILIPSFFAGIRYGIGTDYYSYKNNFEMIKAGNNVRLEKGYSLINYIIAQLGGNIQIVFFIVSLLTIVFIYLTLYDNKEKISMGLGMLIFMLLYYQVSYNNVRQVLAISIILYSIKYIFMKEPAKYIFFILLASSIHTSAIITIILYILFIFIDRENSIRIQIIILTLTFFSVIYYDQIFSFLIGLLPRLDYYAKYFQNKEEFDLGIGLFALNIPYIIPGIFLYKEIKEYDDKFVFYYFIYLFGFIVSLIGYHGVEYLNRIAMNFTIINVILIPYYLKILKVKKLDKMRNLYILIILLTWYVNYIYIGYHQTIPYKTIFNM